MGFSSGTYDYNEEQILRVAPIGEGVYGIFQSSGACVYVGRADNIEQRLLQHVRGDSDQAPCINRNSPSYFQFESTSDSYSRESSLIRELSPICN